MTFRCPRRSLLVLVVGAALVACARTPAPPLPTFELAADRVAVSGVSSGAYMATQTHLAWSDRIGAAGLVAGGPYGCAQGSLEKALGPCMKADPTAPDIDALLALAKTRAAEGNIAALENLQDDRVLVLHGKHDSTVAEAVSLAAFELYRRLMPTAEGDGTAGPIWDGDRPFGHVLPTVSSGGDCRIAEPPYLGACEFDAAGLLFDGLFGTPSRAVEPVAAGSPQLFDQERYRPDGADAYLADSGYIYMPPRCAAGERCGLLIAFHGCEQNAEKIGEVFVRDAGFNRWADAHDVVVLYPQTRASYVPLNPKACWDWWGFSGADHDSRSGVQQRWLMKALEAFADGS